MILSANPEWSSFRPLTIPKSDVLLISSYPPRECGIASFASDLYHAVTRQFSRSFFVQVCALEKGGSRVIYPPEVKFRLDTSSPGKYIELAETINRDVRIKAVVIQHEFGLFSLESAFIDFLKRLKKPVQLAFHTVLSGQERERAENVRQMTSICQGIITMTHHSARILTEEYGVPVEKISIIPHGTHLNRPCNKESLKEKHGLKDRAVLTTFGLLSAGKGIETTLQALSVIVEAYPDVCFLLLGKTHPEVIVSEGEAYRNRLESMVAELGLQSHVRFVDAYLPLPMLLEYLQLTDIYLFTSTDPSQSVSGTFSYAMACGCSIIATPIPHALEVLNNEAGMVIEFQDSYRLAKHAVYLLDHPDVREAIGEKALLKMAATAWENAALAYAGLWAGIAEVRLDYDLAEIELFHVKHLTTEKGMIQFSLGNMPDERTGYMLDDNARALIALSMHFELTGDDDDLSLIDIYLSFIETCQQPTGDFLNYVDQDGVFTGQNAEVDLEEANGLALWALGVLISKGDILPVSLIKRAERIFHRAATFWTNVHSALAIAFAIKGFCYYLSGKTSRYYLILVDMLASRLERIYLHEAKPNWNWFGSYLTYGNAALPEAMLAAYRATGKTTYLKIATESFEFLLSRTFQKESTEAISNEALLQKGVEKVGFGEQPIDVAYTVLALFMFGQTTNDEQYFVKMRKIFSWFMGNNHLRQIIYNPSTGGCYDGLQENQVNVNQGAESTVSYLLARLVMEEHSIRGKISAWPVMLTRNKRVDRLSGLNGTTNGKIY